MKIIYESENPVFAIGCDDLQWILGRTKKNRSDGKLEWDGLTYHPTLSLLMDELTEHFFRKYATKVSQLADLDKTIEKVYLLIRSTIGTMGKEAVNKGGKRVETGFSGKADE